MSTSESTYDAIVVGSGASGSWAVKELTEGGLHVVLLEAGRNLDIANDFPADAKRAGWVWWGASNRRFRASRFRLDAPASPRSPNGSTSTTGRIRTRHLEDRLSCGSEAGSSAADFIPGPDMYPACRITNSKPQASGETASIGRCHMKTWRHTTTSSSRHSGSTVHPQAFRIVRTDSLSAPRKRQRSKRLS